MEEAREDSGTRVQGSGVTLDGQYQGLTHVFPEAGEGEEQGLLGNTIPGQLTHLELLEVQVEVEAVEGEQQALEDLAARVRLYPLQS
jgi:hypothetical protein